MPSFTRPTPRVLRTRFLVTAVALTAFTVAACGDDDPTWPSSGPIEAVNVHTIPSSAPRLLVLQPSSGGGPESLRLLAVPVDAQDMWVDAPVTWSSSSDAVATVNSEGVVTAAGVGTATITATAGGESGTIEVRVRQFPQVETVTITPPQPFLSVGETVQLSAEAFDIGGTAIPGQEFTWSSANENVATVSPTGFVTIVGQGTAEITATTVSDGVPGSTTVTVAEPLQPGTIVVPDVAEGSVRDWSFRVPTGGSVNSFRVQISGGTSGDADLYIYRPGVVPSASNFTCRPFLIGSNETCTVTDPAPGTWRIRVHAFPGDGVVSGLNLTFTTS